jgi:uncharacterized protein (DUF433 family)
MRARIGDYRLIGGRVMIETIGHGVYTYSDAAKLTKLKESRIREWFRIRGERPNPVFRSHYEAAEGERAISFLDLIDVFVAGKLREDDISLRTVRKVYKNLSERLGTDHPFSRKELLTDGKTVFTRSLSAKGQEEFHEALTGQGVFSVVIQPILRHIDYDDISKMALRWHIEKNIVLDPGICFGQPIVKDLAIPTRILFDAYSANENDERKVAAWYDIKPSQVIAAVKFESSLAA